MFSDSAATSSPGSDGSSPSLPQNGAHTYIFIQAVVSSSPLLPGPAVGCSVEPVCVRPLPTGDTCATFPVVTCPTQSPTTYGWSRLNFPKGCRGKTGPPLLTPAPCAVQGLLCSASFGAICSRSLVTVSPPMFYPAPFPPWLGGNPFLRLFLVLKTSFGAKKQLKNPIQPDAHPTALLHASWMVTPDVMTYHLQQGQVSQAHVVEVDLDVDPSDLVGVEQGHAVALVVDHVDVEELARGGVDTPVVLPCKQVHPHDAEDQPEDEADQQDVHDGGDGTQKGIHHHLQGEKRPWGTWIEPSCPHAPTLPSPAALSEVRLDQRYLSIDPTDLEVPENQLGCL